MLKNLQAEDRPRSNSVTSEELAEVMQQLGAGAQLDADAVSWDSSYEDVHLVVDVENARDASAVCDNGDDGKYDEETTNTPKVTENNRKHQTMCWWRVL